MPRPFTIVTFLDTDGDEFPIRVGGHYDAEGSERIQVVDIAGQRLTQHESAGELKPTWPVTVGSIEKFHCGLEAGS